jgi:hypothetical protein
MSASQLEFVAQEIGQMLPRRHAPAKRRAVDDSLDLDLERHAFRPFGLS